MHLSTPQLVSLLQRNGVDNAMGIAREVGRLPGGNAILAENASTRHTANLASISADEGLHDDHWFVPEHAVTAMNACWWLSVSQ